MNRKLAGLGAVVAIAIGCWVLFFRHRGDDVAKPAADKPRSAKIENATAVAPQTPEAPAPRGITPKWSLDVDREGPLRLEGQVVGPDGKGVLGAQVWLSSVPPRSATSEADGGFAFDKLVGRAYVITASVSDPNAELVGGPVTYKLTTSSDPVVIRMSEAAALTVKVVDDTSHPISGAQVKIEGFGDHTEKTSDQGTVKMKPIHPGWVGVEVTATGYALGIGFTTVGSAGATGDLTVTLHKGVAVSGRVIDEHGKPIGRAHVSASDGNPWVLGRDADEVETDAKGQFTFVALAAGTHHLSAVDGEHEPGQSPPITVATRPVIGVEIKLKAGGSVNGIVVDHDGNPSKFATVRIAGTGARMWSVAARQATSDEHGKFELRGLTRAKLQARAESDAAASKLVDVDLSAQATARDLKLVLDVSGTISGIVVDDKNQPVTEVAVNAFPDLVSGASTDGIALAGMSSATTDGAGAFTIHGLPEGPYRLWTGRTSGGLGGGWGRESTPARTGDKAVRIVLPAPGGLVGKVLLDNDKVPVLATVQVGSQPPTPAVGGAFTVKELSPGKYDVTFRGPEFAEYVKHDVEVAIGKTTDIGTIKVPRGRKLLGRVVDGTGAPVADAKVKLGDMLMSSSDSADDRAATFEDMAGIRSASTDQDGNFVIVGVPQKPTNVMADHPDRGRSIAAAVAQGTEDPPPVTLTLRGFGSITGKVTMKGQPQTGVTISESSKGGGAQASFAQTAADGTFTMSKVPEGAHVLMAMQTQMMALKSTSVTVQVTAGKQTTVAIDIPVGAITLDVAIKALANNKVDAAQVFLCRGIVTAKTGKDLNDGFFQGGMVGMKFWFGEGKPVPEFDELVPGEYSLCSIPITGDLSNPQFAQRIQSNVATLAVYCKPTTVAAAPAKQTAVQELPAMTPLPSPTN
ncbi:MAG: hypothetical protein JWO36_6388 [Myxococcales bacterium]|nr:hypothetical protein [Myxococcales bacterium]